MKKHVLLFDFDGTIADTFHYIVELSNRLSLEFNFNIIEPDEVEWLKDKTTQEVIAHLKVPLMKIPSIVSRAKKELQKDIFSIKPVEGLQDILKQLKSLGYELGILTSNSLENVMNFLTNHELDLFDFINTTSKIWSKNTSLKTIIEKNGLKSAKILYIGDETRDIVAAKKAGVSVAAVTWGYNSKKALEACKPDYIINTPKELINILQANPLL